MKEEVILVYKSSKALAKYGKILKRQPNKSKKNKNSLKIATNENRFLYKLKTATELLEQPFNSILYLYIKLV